MPKYTLEFKFKQEAAKGTTAFFFEKPERFQFTAGQYGDYTLIKPKETDDEGDVRSFTIASAPFEDSLFFTTRMRDTAFKRTLSAFEAGDTLTMEGPNGELVLDPESSTPTVFLTGGIGITPVRSIVLQALFEGDSRPFVIIYSNRRPEDAVFVEELTKAAEEHSNLKLVLSMTEADKEEWTGETGHITAEMLNRHVDYVQQSVYYVTGPPELVADLKTLVADLGVPNSSVHTEEFEGY